MEIQSWLMVAISTTLGYLAYGEIGAFWGYIGLCILIIFWGSISSIADAFGRRIDK